MNFFLSKYKRRYFLSNSCFCHWLPKYYFPTMEFNGYQQLFGRTFFKISSFVLNRRRKLIQICNNLKVSKWWQNFHVWLNHPFKLHCFLKIKVIHLRFYLFYTVGRKSEYKLTTENLPSPNHMTHLVPSAARLRPVINQDTIRPGHQENPRNFPHTSSPMPKPRPSCNLQTQDGSTCDFNHFT